MNIQDLIIDSQWSLKKRIFFRFLFVYIFIYCFPFPFSYVSGAYLIINPINNLMQEFALCIGGFILGNNYSIPTEANGSGDTLFRWILLLTNLIFSFFVTIIWSFIDSKRKEYIKLKKLLITYIRYYVALSILGYGFSKIIPPTQFPEINQLTLINSYGQSSPMRLLWTFMGYSYNYQFFGGLVEVIGAGLLLFRRTTLLGSLILIGVMTNVVMMNFSFDVPVKIGSTHYLLFSFGLATIYSRSIINLFFLNQSTQPRDETPIFVNKKWVWTSVTIKYTFISYFFYLLISSQFSLKELMDNTKRSAVMAGVYDVDNYVHNITFDSVSNNYQQYWHRMIFHDYWSDVLIVEKVNGERMQYSISLDTLKNEITGFLFSDSSNQIKLKYEPLRKQELKWIGTSNKDSLYFTTKRFETDSLLLMTRKFRWVSPFPFNK